MKTIIVILLLIAGTQLQAQQSRQFEWLDSLTASRPIISVDARGWKDVTVYFKGLTTADSVRVYNQLDSATGYNATKFGMDTIACAMRDLTTNTDVVAKGLIKALASPLDMWVLNPLLNKLFFKNTDTALDHTIYVRIRGIIY